MIRVIGNKGDIITTINEKPRIIVMSLKDISPFHPLSLFNHLK